jgi:small-conductance mechanosensitive channel
MGFFQDIVQSFEHPLWSRTFLGNSVGEYTVALVALLVLVLLFKVLQRLVLQAFRRLAKRTRTDIDDMLIRIVDSFHPPFYSFLAFYLALRFLSIDPTLSKVLDVVIISWAAYQGVVAVQIVLDYAVQKRFQGEGEEDPDTRAAVRFMRNLVRATLWVLALLLVLSNLGVNITSLVAGLGIGGIAVAFALQNILGDLFSSFVIHFDKPFKIGDFIIVGEHMGTVERVGIKTTRIRALQGEEIVISNQELTGARIQNFKRMDERRVVHGIGVTYDTPAEKMERIPGIIGSIVDPIDGVRFDRAHFKGFGASSLDFEVVYYILSSDYNEYMDLQQKINMAILKSFEAEGVSFAFPSQTVYLAKE